MSDFTSFFPKFGFGLYVINYGSSYVGLGTRVHLVLGPFLLLLLFSSLQHLQVFYFVHFCKHMKSSCALFDSSLWGKLCGVICIHMCR
jgi:hypothetical protein